MMQHPPACGGAAVHSSSMDQQHQPQQQYSVSQPQPTTSTVQEEEVRTLWIGDLHHWMDKVEEKEFRTLWIGDLQNWMDEAYIDSCFSHTGEIFTSKVIRNGKSSDESYGFIEFKSRAIAEGILHKFDGTPMPRMAVGTNFTLNWASSSSFGSGGEKQQQGQEEEDDSAAAAAVDDDKQMIVTTDSLLPLGVGTRTPQPTDLLANSGWEDMLKWWSVIAKETRTPQVVYAAHRVYMIGAFFKKIYDVPPDEIIVELLDELPRHVVSIDIADIADIAEVFHSIDAFYPLLGKLSHQHAGIRAKATKVISAMVHNNPTSQQLVIEAGFSHIILDNFLTNIDPNLETIHLDAISSLFWNEEPCISAFGMDQGYEFLSFILDPKILSSNPCSQRKALDLIARLVVEHKSDCKIVTELEYPRIIMNLVISDDAEVRKAALKCLIALAGVEKGLNRGQVIVIGDVLKKFLQLFEPLLRAWAAVEAADRNFVGEKKAAPISLALGTPSAAFPTS